MARNADDDPRAAIRRLNWIGLLLALLLIGGFGTWAMTTELSGAVIAPGSLVVESNTKKVQHPTGGVVGELLVDEGDEVEAGQVLLRLDGTASRSALGVIQAGLDTQLIRRARLVAERDGADDMDFPAGLADRRDDPSVTSAFTSEVNLFLARRNTLMGQVAQLREQIKQLNEQIAGLTARKNSQDDEIRLVKRDLDVVQDLYEKNLVSSDRRSQLQRSLAELDGAHGQTVADIAAARGKISEIELQALQAGKDFQTEVLNQLRDAEDKISQLSERKTAAEDQLRRLDIRAPQSGTVHELAVHTVGGVIAPGETIMQIVPRADTLVIDAKIVPQDVDQVSLGAIVTVRLLAANRRTVPTLTATVTRLSADLNHDPGSDKSYYLVRAAFTDADKEALRSLPLLPGMPAEVYIQTQMRTPLEYLTQPLREQIARTFRER